jgi:hypothetical protein
MSSERPYTEEGEEIPASYKIDTNSPALGFFDSLWQVFVRSQATAQSSNAGTSSHERKDDLRVSSPRS